MDLSSLNAAMRRLEAFHDLRAPDHHWIIIRVDGRSFSKLTETSFNKPFDERFKTLMAQSTHALMTDLQACIAYTQSDEISLLLPKHTQHFDRRVEKLVSTSAAAASAHFSLGLGQPVQFDARLWLGADLDQVQQYFQWRRADATRCALNTACYWALRHDGLSPARAHSLLQAAPVSQKNELLLERGINFNALPAWQRHGYVTSWRTYEKAGFNPITKQTVHTTRRALFTDEDLPDRARFADYITSLIPTADQ